jgi:putative transposase
VVEAPNDVWTVDFKGWWRTADGTRCEPLTVRDAFSRFVLDLRILPATSTEHVRPTFERLFARYGVPRAIHSDNGQPFASTQSIAGLSKLSAWWVSLGITLVRNRPGCPQDNGGHERMHGDIRFEIQSASAPTVSAQQKICDEWRAEFNHVRPPLCARLCSNYFRDPSSKLTLGHRRRMTADSRHSASRAFLQRRRAI